MASRSRPLSLTILVTGFGPFPGAPFNPTGPMVERLARLRRPALTDIKIVPYVFPTSYAAVDRELPRLIAKHRPRALLMFGLAARTKSLRIETRAQRAGPSARCLWSIAAAKFHSSRRPSELGPVRPNAVPVYGRSQRSCARHAIARCRTLFVQLSVLARGRGVPQRRRPTTEHFRPRAGHTKNGKAESETTPPDYR